LDIIIEKGTTSPAQVDLDPYLLVGEAELVLQHCLPVGQGLHLISQGVEGVDQRLGEVLKTHPTALDGEIKVFSPAAIAC
jgi:hypothetical protein